MPEAFIVDAVRTAGGRKGGRLAGWHPADLAAAVLDALMARTGIDPAAIEDVILGCVRQAGEQSTNVARNAVLASRLPETVPGTSVDRQCGSSQQALHFAAQAVMAGAMDAVIAGGVESMTRVPIGLPARCLSVTGWAATCASRLCRHAIQTSNSASSRAAKLAAKYGLSGTHSTTLHSQPSRASEPRRPATSPGRSPASVSSSDGAPTGETPHIDEGIRFEITREAIAAVKLLLEGGRLTAATASQICDGAAALLIVSERGLKLLGHRRDRWHASII